MRCVRLVFSAILLLSLFVCRALGNGTPNQPPTINLGADVTVRFPDPVHLSATVTDDGPGPFYVSWSGTGPGYYGPDFASYSGATNTAFFPAPGTYTITATASDYSATASDSMTITVLPGDPAGTSLTMTSDPGSVYGGTGTLSYTLQTGSFWAAEDYDGVLGISYQGTYQPSRPPVSWYLEFAAPVGPLKPGTFADTTTARYPRSVTAPYFEVRGLSGSAGTEGQFEVKKIVYGEGRRVVAFWATFEIHRAGETAALRGEIRYNITTSEPPLNRAPGAYAGSNQRLFLTGAAQFAGVASDDDLPAPPALTTTWTKYSGPGDVTFADASALATTATFSTPGTYVLDLAAADGALTSHALMNAVVVDPNEETLLRVTSEPGDLIAPGFTAERRAIDADFTATAGYQGGATVYVNLPAPGLAAEFWQLELAAPSNAPLRVGRYESTWWQDYRAFDQALLRIYGPGFNSGSATGSIEVKKIIYGESGSVASLWATFELRAAGATGALRGEIKFHAEANTPPANRPPGLYAGESQRVLHPTTVALHGYASDDGLPNAVLATTWSKAGGPGDVTFADASALETTATFSTPGKYTLLLTADDGYSRPTSSVQVLVVDPAEDTSVRISSEPGDPVGAGENHTYTPLDADIVAYADGNRLAVEVNDPVTRQRLWTVNLIGPGNAPPSAGIRIATALSYYSTAAALFVAPPTRYPTSGDGSFAIRQIELGAAGEVLSLWATFTQRDKFGTGSLTGEVRYRLHSPTVVNRPPAALLPPALTIDRVSPALLEGRVGDDELLGAALPVTWSKVSGPGHVVFASPNSPRTTATLSLPGTYVLRLAANDGTYTGSTTVTVVKTHTETSLRLHSKTAGGTNVRDWYYTKADGDFAAFAYDGLQFSFYSLESPYVYWNAFLLQPYSESPHVGRFEGAGDYPTRTDSRAALRLAGSDGFYQPSDFTSSFEVKNFVGDTSSVTSCWVTFTIHAGDVTLTGELRYNVIPSLPPRITLPAEMTVSGSVGQLDAIVTDDDLPAGRTLDLHWTALDSAAPVSFDSPHTASTAVRFAAPGTYRLQLSASDGEVTSFATVTVRVVLDVSNLRGRWAGFIGIPGRGTLGFARITLNGRGGFTGSLQFGSRVVPVRGEFETNGRARIPLRIVGQDGVLSLTGGDLGQLTLALDTPDESITANLQWQQRVAPNPATIGSFAFVFGPPRSGLGSGWAKVAVRRSGTVSIVGVLADGTPLSAGTTLCAANRFQAFAPLAPTDWFALDASFESGGTWSGRPYWRRTQLGIDTDLGLSTSQLVRLVPDREPLTGSAGPVHARLIVEMQNRPAFDMPVTIHPGGRTSGFGEVRIPNRYILNGGLVVNLPSPQPTFTLSQLAIRPGGGFSGFVIDPLTRRAVHFSGLILGDFFAGFGSAQSGASLGSVTLVAP